MENENKRQIGSEGEDIAEEFLTAKGMIIKKRNFHFGKIGEIDLIAMDGKTLVFVEVRLRRSSKYGNPIDSITPSKIKNVRRTAEGYLYVNKIKDVECRFDVVGIDLADGKKEITHLPFAF